MPVPSGTSSAGRAGEIRGSLGKLRNPLSHLARTLIVPVPVNVAAMEKSMLNRLST